MNAYDLRCSWCDAKARDRAELADHESEHRRAEMGELDKLRLRLKDMDAALRIMEGEKPTAAERIAAEVNRALDAIERGNYEIVEHRKEAAE